MKNKTNRTLKKILSIALCLALVMSYVPMVSITAGAAATDITVNIDTGASVTLRDADGDDYYDIGTADELYAFAAEVNNGNNTINGELTADITVNQNVLTEDGELNGDGSNFRGWTPIGDASNKYYGTFDGWDHTVSGLYVVCEDWTIIYAGLFGYVGSGGTVQNTGVVDSWFSVIGTVGGVVGWNDGTVEYCYNTGTVSGDSVVGGVVGTNDNTVEYCYNTGTVSGDSKVGGVVGTNANTVQYCYNTGAFSGENQVGGVVGSNGFGIVRDCYNAGTSSWSSGGVIGDNFAKVEGCYLDASLNLDKLQLNYSDEIVDVRLCSREEFASGQVCYYLNGYIADGVWKQTLGTDAYPNFNGGTVYPVANCNGERVFSNTNEDIGHTYTNGICTVCNAACEHTGGEATCTEQAVCETCGASYGDLDPDNHEYEKYNGFCSVCDACEPAELNANSYYEIGNAGQLFWFANYINTVDRTANAVLTADIDLEKRLWTPIGSTNENSNNFRGVFDGQNHTIKGLYVEGGRAGLGFFGEVRTGTVKNFTIYGEVVVNTEVNYVGGVIGSICGLNGDNDLERNGAVIQNITSYVNLTAKTHGIGMIGGFAGYANHESLIENCSWYGTFDADIYRVDSGAGGFIGKIQENTSKVTIRNCGAYGTIKTNYAKNSYNNTATIYMGGFLSFSNTNAETSIENCLFAGKFEKGSNLTDEARLGAFGTLRGVKSIKNCYYLGDDGLEAVHSDSSLKPGENIDIISVTKEQLASGEVAYLLGEAWGQMSNTEGSLPIITDNELYKVVTVGETGNYSVANVGDTNGDGTVDVNDYQALVNKALADDHEQIEAASYDDIVKYDLDGDGYLDVIDASIMHLFINGFTTVDVYAVGDYDLNGVAFEEADIKAIKHAIENPENLSTAEKYTSDVNGDGKLDENDLTVLTAKYGEVTGTECAANV